WMVLFFFSSRRRHTRSKRDWSSDVCSSDLASPSIPNILLVKPNGSAYGMGRLSVYIPTTGCITEETMLSVNAMSPSCVKDSPRDFSKIGNIAGITACRDRKSTRLNSSHVSISYAVFCLKKKRHTIEIN